MSTVVTVAAFVVATWICGAFVLPLIMKDGSSRWAVATALGVAVAALAALWGYSFATDRATEQATDREATNRATERATDVAHGGTTSAAPIGPTTRSGRISNKISGGHFHGPVIQARDISGPVPGGAPVPPGQDSGTQD